GEGQAMIGDLLLERLPGSARRMRHRRWMHAESAQLDAIVAEMLQLVQDLVEVGGRLLLIEQIRPGADGEFLHGGVLMMREWSMTTINIADSASACGFAEPVSWQRQREGSAKPQARFDPLRLVISSCDRRRPGARCH